MPPIGQMNPAQPLGRTIPTCEVTKEGAGKTTINQSDLKLYQQNGYTLVEGSEKGIGEVDMTGLEPGEKPADAPGANNDGSGGSGLVNNTNLNNAPADTSGGTGLENGAENNGG